VHRFRLLLIPFVLLASLAAVTAAQASNSNQSGAVYTLTNSPAGNAVSVFDRAADGSLTAAGSFATGGTGTGGGLGSQGALALSDNGNLVFAVNAGSNSVSEFAVQPQGLQLVGTVASGGTLPISLTVHGNLVYVLNAGGAGNISGFTVDSNGLTPLVGSTQPLSSAGAGPAEVLFSPDGRTLVVTEKNARHIDTYAVGPSGIAAAPIVSASAGVTPFGFDFDKAGHLLVSEAGSNSASSYTVGAAGVNVITGALSTNGQRGVCWLIASKNGKYAYTVNAGSGTITGFSVAADGSLALLDPSGVSANLGAGSHPLDPAVSGNGRFLYNLTDGNHAITGFQIGEDGSLTQVSVTNGLPAGAAGIVAS
jgi:6-phosphogluconolactonase